MKIAEDYKNFDFSNFFYSWQQTNKMAFKLGQKDMLEKVLAVLQQWEKGLYNNEEFTKTLKDFQKEFYGKSTKN